MGCGRSKLQSIYPRHRTGSSKNKHSKDQEKCEENGNAVSANQETVGNSEESPEARRKAAIARGRQFISSPALFAMAEVSTSQEDFFKMLDEKIENGPDYDSSAEENSLQTTSPKFGTSSTGSAIGRLHFNSNVRPLSSSQNKMHYPQLVTTSPSRSTRSPSPRKPQRLLPTLQASPPPHEPTTL